MIGRDILPAFSEPIRSGLFAAGLIDHAAWRKTQAAEVILTSDEQARVEKLRRAEQRVNLSAALSARRTWLAGKFGVSPDVIRLESQPEGAPILSAPEAHAVSFSRSGPLSALAIGRDQCAFGLDIEQLREVDHVASLGMVCLPEEAAAMAQVIAAAPKEPRFLRLWTLKEAVLKATGRGFRADAQKVRLAPDMVTWPGPHLIQHEGTGIYLAEWLEMEGCVLALAQAPRSDTRTHIGPTS